MTCARRLFRARYVASVGLALGAVAMTLVWWTAPGNYDTGDVPTPDTPRSVPAAETPSLDSPTPTVTTSDGWPFDDRPMPGVHPDAIVQQLTRQYGLKFSPGSFRTATLDDPKTGTSLQARVVSDSQHRLRGLVCYTNSNGQGFLASCVTLAIPGSEQQAALSRLDAIVASPSRPPNFKQRPLEVHVGIYEMSMYYENGTYALGVGTSVG